MTIYAESAPRVHALTSKRRPAVRVSTREIGRLQERGRFSESPALGPADADAGRLVSTRELERSVPPRAGHTMQQLPGEDPARRATPCGRGFAV